MQIINQIKKQLPIAIAIRSDKVHIDVICPGKNHIHLHGFEGGLGTRGSHCTGDGDYVIAVPNVFRYNKKHDRIEHTLHRVAKSKASIEINKISLSRQLKEHPEQFIFDTSVYWKKCGALWNE